MSRAPLLAALLLVVLSAPVAAEDREPSIDELEALELRIVENDAALDAATRRLRELEGRVEALELQSGEADDRLAERRRRAAVRIRAMYRFRHRGFLPLLFSAESPHDLLRAARYFARILRSDRLALDRLDREVAGARALEEQLGTERAQLLTAAGQAHLEREQARTLRNEKRRLVGRLRPPERRRFRQREIEGARAKLDFQLDLRKEAPPDDIAVEAIRPNSTFARTRGALPLPAVGTIERTGRGAVIAAAAGAKIRAVHDGDVLRTLWIDGYGKVLLLDHGDGWRTVYGHASEYLVTAGELVHAGDEIGLVGETGSMDGPRLYFEVRQGRNAEDPLDWLRIPAGVTVRR